MYCEELSNSVQSIDLHDSSTPKGVNDTLNGSDEVEEISLEKAIRRESQPILPSGYRLSHCLAEGGVGRVFLVVNPETKDCLAAKVVNASDIRSSPSAVAGPPEAKQTRYGRERTDLRREAELQRRLRHHHIANVYGIRNTTQFTFMFMELLPGGELFERIPIGIGLHIQQMFVYFSQILDALDYLHNKELIAHLDVKPENIMLSKRDRAKLIDFGWAVDLRKTSMLQGPVGTMSYAAPEVFSRSPYAGPPVDIFSLGVTLLTAVTGQRCWSRANLHSDPIYLQWCERRDLHKGPFFSRLPPDLINFLTRILAHKPVDRFSVEEIRAHPWYRRGLARRLTPVAPPPPPSTETSDIDFLVGDNTPVPSSQPITKPTTQNMHDSSEMPNISLSQPADLRSMLMATEAVYKQNTTPEEDRLGFSCLMRRMTRFFSALATMEHTMEVVRAVVVQRRQMTIDIRGRGNILVTVKQLDHLNAVFRIMMYPLAGSILVDCRRVSGDGLLFHQSYALLYGNLLSMGAVNDAHPYLNMVLPDRLQPKTETAKETEPSVKDENTATSSEKRTETSSHPSSDETVQ